ncbi:hypothetical protein GCM10008018_15010 [Paenibacillus marchantiophytorum]|uniref:HTH araC/xylS-type domain-containing protein n=1 Tax=Paenibacillus marchantiophytorum TaxID=1619310 RepID=A0ABQ2BTU0_9BACL|nr:AraC family transcriptional regulator [Paenibacillus marchantiophytorum]GGI46015.1 hypothetical protein GCM10008018_15010 [Paenibacillus marchantiophytorum]
MNIAKKFQSKNVARVCLWFVSAILLVISILSYVVYFYVQEEVVEREYNNSRVLLAQSKKNIEYADNMVRQLLLSIYNKNDVRSLMDMNNESAFDPKNVIDKLRNSVVWNRSFVQSVYIYNNNKKIYFSTYGEILYKDTELEKLLQEHGGAITPLKPVIRDIDVSLDSRYIQMEKVLTYVMYEQTDEMGRMDGAVIINIKLEWLHNNIHAFNNGETEQLNEMFILSDNRHLINVCKELSERGTKLEALFIDKYQSVGESGNFFSIRLDGTKYLTAYIPIDNTGWVLFKTVPYDEAYGLLIRLRTYIVVIVLLVTLLILFQLSRGIRKPVDKLVPKLRSSHVFGEASESLADDLIYLQDVYRSHPGIFNYQCMKKRFLRKWVLNSLSVSCDELALFCQEYKLSFRQDGQFKVCILKFDNYKLLAEKKIEEKELLTFAVMNIASEFVSKVCHTGAVDLQHDHVAMILQADMPSDMLEETVLLLLKECQTYLFQYYRLSITAVLSVSVTDYTHVTTAYQQALNVSMYRFLAGKMSVLTQDNIAKLGRNSSIERLPELEKQLLEQVRNGNHQESADKLAVLLEEVRQLDYCDMMLTLRHTVNQFKYLVSDLNQLRQEPVKVNTILMRKELLESETISEFQTKLMDVIYEVTSSYEAEDNQVAEVADIALPLQIEQIIAERYADMNLGAAEIALIVGAPAVKVGKIFRIYKKMSITDYINRVRLDKAVEWMENSELPIQDIIHRVGIESESYFYKTFKAKLGATPREFMAKRAKERI